MAILSENQFKKFMYLFLWQLHVHCTCTCINYLWTYMSCSEKNSLYSPSVTKEDKRHTSCHTYQFAPVHVNSKHVATVNMFVCYCYCMSCYSPILYISLPEIISSQSLWAIDLVPVRDQVMIRLPWKVLRDSLGIVGLCSVSLLNVIKFWRIWPWGVFTK